MAELVRGAFVPLFDRLQDSEGPSDGLSRLLTPAQLELSIGRELSRLMNTRSPLTLDEYPNSTGTTIEYGIPDIGFLSPQSHADMGRLESAILQAVLFYEPRLNQVTVKAFAPLVVGRPATLLISGSVTIDFKLRQLNFELQLDAQRGGLAKAT
jgi:type VI secretion system protein ImpF